MIKNCGKCIHKIPKTKKEMKTDNNNKRVSPTSGEGDNTPAKPSSRYGNFKCDQKHELKFGIIDCKNFAKSTLRFPNKKIVIKKTVR